MNNFTRPLIIIFILFISNLTFAQEQIFEDIKNVKLRNFGTIDNQGDILGYYFFYQTEKVKKKTFGYELVILDQDLNTIKKSKTTGSKHLLLLEGKYNGAALVLKFLDSKERILEYKVYGKDGELAYKKKKELKKKEVRAILVTANKEGEIFTNGIHPVGNVGFVDLTYVKDKRLHYALTFLPSKSKDGYWEKTSDFKKGHSSASFVHASNDRIFCNTLHRKNILKNKFDVRLTTFDVKDGKKLNEILTSEGNNLFLAFNGFEDNEQVNILGTFFNKDEDVFKSQPAGLTLKVLSKDGEIVNSKKTKWKGIATSRKEANSNKKKGKSGDEFLGNIFFHKIIRKNDGTVYAIGEYFKKKADGVGIAVSMLGGSASLVKMYIDNMVIMEFNENFEMIDNHVFEKEGHGVFLPAGSSFASPTLLGHYIKSFGGFDYSFTQVSNDNDFFIAGFMDYGKKKKDKQFRMISHLDNEYTEDAINLVSDATNLRVFKAKTGHILIAEYFKKKKSLNLRLEKSNF